MAEYAMWYNQQGMHALIVTLGGYGASEAPPDGPSEGSSYLDADAALYWLRQEGCPGLALRRIVAHGLSLGGAQAAALAAHHKGLHVSLDQTFGSAEQVARHVASHHLGFTSTWAADTVAATAIPDHRREKEWQRNVDGGDGDHCDDNVAVLRGNNHHPRAINTPTMNPLPHQTTLPWPFCGAALPGFLGFGSGVQSDSNNSSSSSHQSSGRRVIKGLRDPKAHKSMLLVAASADADWAETGEGCVEANHPYYALDGYENRMCKKSSCAIALSSQCYVHLVLTDCFLIRSLALQSRNDSFCARILVRIFLSGTTPKPSFKLCDQMSLRCQAVV